MLSKHSKLNQLIKQPLSGHQLMKLLDKKANIMFYHDLKDVDDIDDIFINNACVLFEQSDKSSIGHWVCLIKRGNTIEFFDSFGDKPDEYLKLMSKYFRNSKGMKKPHLSYLLFNSPYKIEFSEFKLQNVKAATCGHWVISRINNKNMKIKDFADYFRRHGNNYTNDELIILNSMK